MNEARIINQLVQEKLTNIKVSASWKKSARVCIASIKGKEFKGK